MELSELVEKLISATANNKITWQPFSSSSGYFVIFKGGESIEIHEIGDAIGVQFDLLNQKGELVDSEYRYDVMTFWYKVKASVKNREKSKEALIVAIMTELDAL